MDAEVRPQQTTFHWSKPSYQQVATVTLPSLNMASVFFLRVRSNQLAHI